MNIFNIKTSIINDDNYLKHLSGTLYLKQDDYEFLDIRDNRNGEVYEFYRLKDKEKIGYFIEIIKNILYIQ